MNVQGSSSWTKLGNGRTVVQRRSTIGPFEIGSATRICGPVNAKITIRVHVRPAGRRRLVKLEQRRDVAVPDQISRTTKPPPLATGGGGFVMSARPSVDRWMLLYAIEDLKLILLENYAFHRTTEPAQTGGILEVGCVARARKAVASWPS
ncbi:hypothetical protein [Streptomyces sp. NPDC050121]|uniref:hypothetical protein n=1 Tax=Streptomyces sp. NPDC050121 TaxID=3365601 RepID=UPI0037AA7FEF